jgi:hypothetical protein
MGNWAEASQIAMDIFHHSPFQGRFSSEEKAAYLLELSQTQWRELSKAKRKEATSSNLKQTH